MKEFKTIKENISSQVIEKKSRFIGNMFYVENTKKVEEILASIKKEYYDARHNCYAYRIIDKNNIIEKCSDDGEPSGTAGTQILNILTSNKLVNVLLIVTRYFGGTLLGTGGLTRCYSLASKECIRNDNIVTRCLGIELRVNLNYSDFNNFKYYIEKINGKVNNVNYLDYVEATIEVLKEYLEDITKNNSEKNFKILKYDILKEKYIDISILT